jgi:hypothetical protein
MNATAKARVRSDHAGPMLATFNAMALFASACEMSG